ncbi:MAG: hypothetical protein QOI99_1317, partial [Actinomycetota bacterium]|nr:hypothetical protein [Actinomycetota bacterium]
RLAEAAATQAEEAAAETDEGGGRAEAPAPKPKSQPKSQPKSRGRSKDDDNAVVGYLKSREGRSMINTVARGVFGLLRKRH